jgi:hypothetical protein
MKMNQVKFLDVFVTREEVNNFHMGAVKVLAALPGKWALSFSFDGYNEDPREVWEIPEIVAYVRQALEKHPNFLSKLDQESRGVLRNCICRGSRPLNADGTYVPDPVDFLAWQTYASAAGIDPWR